MHNHDAEKLQHSAIRDQNLHRVRLKERTLEPILSFRAQEQAQQPACKVTARLI